MELVSLDRFKLEGFLGSGSDYEAHGGTDLETGQPVVVKRPNPDYITRQLHRGVDLLSETLIEVHRSIGDTTPCVARLVGYSELTQHGSYFGDSLNVDYRVLVFERARGIPLVADIRDKFKGIPIGLGQNLFALHPLAPHPTKGAFAIHHQLLDVEEAFQAKGHLLLDLRPENVYFDPAQCRITIIDTGTVPTQGAVAQGRASAGNQQRDIHDFYAEVFRFYLAPQTPPAELKGYEEPFGMRAVPDFGGQVATMVSDFSRTGDSLLAEAACATLGKIRDRAYSSMEAFRQDLQGCLDAVEMRNARLEELGTLLDVWHGAREKLSEPYWGRFLFDPATDLP